MSRVFTCVWVMLLFVESALAQRAPQDQAPQVTPPYYRVRYEASTDQGKLIYPVTYTAWIPPGVKTLRAVIVHQHGCGEGSCKSGQTGAFDLHWQSLARQHDCALLAPSYEQPGEADCQMWCDPRNGSDQSFQEALKDLGNVSGHNELAALPWALWGHSGGGHWAGGMLLLHPERVAAVWLRSGVPLFEPVATRPIKPHVLSVGASQVPVMCNLGVNEGVRETSGRFASVWPANQAFFAKMRSQGALIAVAIDPMTSHECGNQRYLAIPWLDECLTLRLPKKISDPLQTISRDQGWIAPLQSGSSSIVPPVPSADFQGDRLQTIWLPNEAMARAWTQYVTDTRVIDSTPPPAPSDLKLNGNKLTWNAEADLESGVASFIIQRDDQTLATVPEKNKNPFGRPIFQGLQYSDTPMMPLSEMEYVIADEPGSVDRYRVRSMNTAGLISP